MEKIDTYYVYQDHPVNTILSHFCSPLLTMDISHCTDGPNAFDRNLKGFQDYVIIVRWACFFAAWNALLLIRPFQDPIPANPPRCFPPRSTSSPSRPQFCKPSAAEPWPPTRVTRGRRPRRATAASPRGREENFGNLREKWGKEENLRENLGTLEENDEICWENMVAKLEKMLDVAKCRFEQNGSFTCKHMGPIDMRISFHHLSSKQNLGAINSLPTKHVDFTKKDRTIVLSLKNSENPRCCHPVFFHINCKKNKKTKRILKDTPSSNIWKAHWRFCGDQDESRILWGSETNASHRWVNRYTLVCWYYLYLVGGFDHLGWDDDIPYMKWKIKNVWNHQPVIYNYLVPSQKSYRCPFSLQPSISASWIQTLSVGYAPHLLRRHSIPNTSPCCVHKLVVCLPHHIMSYPNKPPDTIYPWIAGLRYSPFHQFCKDVKPP